MITQEQAYERVSAGAAYLDQIRPGWHNQIDEGTLELSHPYHCIIGQLCGHRWDPMSLGLASIHKGG
jgi:hypothetical protein